MNIDLEFNPQMLMVGINYHTASDAEYYYHTLEVFLFFFRITIDKPEKY